MAEPRQLVFVDDEPNIVKSLTRVFLDDDYEIQTFASAEEALKFINKNPVELIISDQRMPGMTGSELFKKVRQKHPHIIRILLTGYADMDATIEAINDGWIYKFLLKPWNDEELHATVQRALEFYDISRENERLMVQLEEKNKELEKWNVELGIRVKERTKLFVEKNIALNKLNKGLEQSIVGTVKVFVGIIAMYDRKLGAHAQRVASLVVTLSEQLEYNSAERQDLEVAALLHDLGKLGIPRDVIDKKVGALTDSEKRMLRNHPVAGSEILMEMDIFETAAKIIRHHQERWDGKGYPDGLSGENIPASSRLIAICKSFDRLFNIERGNNRGTIKDHFKSNSGTLYEPKLCEIIDEYINQQTKEALSKDGGRRFAEVMPSELRAGMMLAGNLHTGSGIFLLPHGQVLKEPHIESIQEMHRIDPISGMIRVFITEEAGS
ncbi:response regulator [bacterium]|nr:response regulator [bacterium]